MRRQLKDRCSRTLKVSTSGGNRQRVLVNPPCNEQFNATLENRFNIADQFAHQFPLSPPSVLRTRPLLSCPLADGLRKPSSKMQNSFSGELFAGFLAGTGCFMTPLIGITIQALTRQLQDSPLLNFQPVCGGSTGMC